MLGLHFCARASSNCGKWGPLFIAVRGPLTIAASLVAEHKLQTRRLSNCGPQAQSLRGMWDPPRPGPEPVSPALAGRFSTTAPPGKPCRLHFYFADFFFFLSFFFLCRSFLVWCSPNLFITAFVACTFGAISKNHCHRAFSLFSSSSFIGSGLTFKSLIHFKVIFVSDVR